ncbi:MAG: hypothetical protein M0Z46_01985 [Actinomycetota bacterium]|nr:hypothetical protein [Actinomycetota bacterium]
MKRRIGGLIGGAAALGLVLLGLPGATAQAASPHKPARGPAPGYTFTVTNTGTNVLSLGTSSFLKTETATGTHATGTGTHGLTASSRIPAGHVPDIGTGENVAGAPGPRGKGRQPKPSAAAIKAVTTAATTKTVSAQVTTSANPSLASTAGIDAYAEGVLHPVTVTGVAQPLPGVDVEPPDQGLCSNGTKVMEVNNEVMQVFTAKNLKALGGNGMALERLFKTPEIFGGTGHSGINVQGDPRCFYDPASGRWFASQIWLDESGLVTQYGWAGVFVAVSETATPMGRWYVFFIPDMSDAKATTTCNNLPFTTLPGVKKKHGRANPCFGDQPLLGVNGNSVYISTNEYSIYSGTLGGAANVYFLSKSDLVKGEASPIFWAHPGDTVARPGAPATHTALHYPWYSIVPAVSAGTYVSTNTGTLYGLSNVTFTTTGGTQGAVWQFTNTAAVTGLAPHITGSVAVVTTVAYSEPGLATQKAGPVPLGHFWRLLADATTAKHPYSTTKPMPEGKIATNTDRVTTAAYDPATGAVWAGINTAVTHTTQTGIAWFSGVPRGVGATLKVSTVTSGVLSATTGANVFFPSITFTSSGKGLMDYALTGTTYFPSTAYSLLTGTMPTGIHVARMGAGPEDGFTEYQYETTPTAAFYRPRWGDYSTALAAGTTFFFASEMINQSCSPGTFGTTFTCGGTRDRTANWGTSVNMLPATG